MHRRFKRLLLQSRISGTWLSTYSWFVWIADAPVYGVNDDKDIVTEVDNNVLAWNNGKKPGRNPNGLYVVPGTPTGKLMHSVHGNTLYALFKIPPN